MFAPYRHGPGDPTYRVGADGAIWRGLGTPEGPAALCVRTRPADAEVELAAWGPGAGWAVAAAPRMLGAEDDPTGFDPEHPVLRAAWRRHRHWRVGRSGLVMDSLLPVIIEQKVTGQEAFAAYARLVRRFGVRAPGPREDLYVAPGAEALRQIPSWEWLKLPVDGGRSRAIIAAARVGAALERLAQAGAESLDGGLRATPGIGVWTSAEVRQRVLGDADAVSFGDFHVAKDIGWALTGAAIDDAALAEVLAPYRPHRYRVQALVSLSGSHRPRRGPRMAPRVHLPNT